MVMVLTGLVGCQKRDRKTSVRHSGEGVSETLTDPQRQQVASGTCSVSGNSELNGFVYENSSYSGQFQNKVYKLLTAMGDPNASIDDGGLELGSVNGLCSSNDRSGIRFMGNINTDTDGVSLSQQNYASIINSELVIVIFDSTSIEQNIPGISIGGTSKTRVYGKIEGNNLVQVTMEWENGDIVLDGWFTGQNYEGTVYFKNLVHYDGRQPDSNWDVLGSFKVPACSFFKCK